MPNLPAQDTDRIARLAELKTVVLDRSRTMEARLRAHMQIDAIVWSRRTMAHECIDNSTPDKISISKKRAEDRRQNRLSASRIARGMILRPRARRFHVVTTLPSLRTPRPNKTKKN